MKTKIVVGGLDKVSGTKKEVFLSLHTPLYIESRCGLVLGGHEPMSGSLDLLILIHSFYFKLELAMIRSQHIFKTLKLTHFL